MQVSINGKNFEVPDGSSINVINNKLFVDGQEYNGPGYESKEFKITVTGGLASIKVERGNVEVHGNVEGTVDAGGSVNCQNVGGKVDAGGSVRCGNISGDVDAGGSVTCGDIAGSVDAGGSIRRN